MKADGNSQGKPDFESSREDSLRSGYDAGKTGRVVLWRPSVPLGRDRRVAEQLQSFLRRIRYPWEGDFANSMEIDSESTSLGPAIGCAANAEMDADGEWVRLAVYGDHPYGAKDLQILDKRTAEELVGNFRSAANSLLRRVFGGNPRRPIYMGHPDHPLFAAQGHDDFTLRGEIEDLDARSDGLYAKTRLTDAGKTLLSSGEKLYWSPRWVTKRAGKRAEKTLWKPVKLLSSGLTPTPNIYGSAANAEVQEENEKGNSSMGLLKKMVEQIGFSAEEAEAVASGAEGAPSHDAILQKLTGGPKQEDLDAANAELEEVKADRDTALADLANERRGRATLLVEQAIEQGRVAAADRESEIESLAESKDFANAATALLTRAKVLPSSGGKAKEIGERKGEMQDIANATNVFNAALKDFANEAGLDLQANYQVAYGRFAQTEKGKELIAQMRKGKS